MSNQIERRRAVINFQETLVDQRFLYAQPRPDGRGGLAYSAGPDADVCSKKPPSQDGFLRNRYLSLRAKIPLHPNHIWLSTL